MKLFNTILLGISSFSLFAQAHDFSLPSTSGKTYHLYSELDSGKTVILDFFSIRCGTCILSVPDLEKIWQNFGANGDSVWLWGIEISRSEAPYIDTFMNKYGGTYPALATFENDSLLNEENYNVNYSPQYCVVCSNRKYYFTTLGEVETMVNLCRQTSTYKPEIKNTYTIYNSNGFIYTSAPDQKSYLIELYNLHGEKVFSHLTRNNFPITLPKNLPEGIYLARLLANNKIIKTTKLKL